MTEVRTSPSSKATAADTVSSSLDGHVLLPERAVPAQARREFDAAIRRANAPEDETAEATEDPSTADSAAAMLSMLMPLPALGGHAGQCDNAWQGGCAPGQSSATQRALASAALADAVPMAPQSLVAGMAQPMRLQLPIGGAEVATLALRLAQTGAGQWQVRLGGDAAVRQQLAPHLDRLRERMRDRGQSALDDLGFDDDTGY